VVFLRKLRVVVFELDVEEIGVSEENLHDLWRVNFEEGEVGNDHRRVKVDPELFERASHDDLDNKDEKGSSNLGLLDKEAGLLCNCNFRQRLVHEVRHDRFVSLVPEELLKLKRVK